MFWWNKAVEATEVIEAAGVPDGKDITNSSKCQQLLIFEAKEAVEVIEANKFIMSVEVFEATEVVNTT